MHTRAYRSVRDGSGGRDDERAAVGCEVPVRDVDRDPLLALGPEAVEQEREVEGPVLRTEAARVCRERLQVIVAGELR